MDFKSELNQSLDHPWRKYTYVAFDTETSGAYPLGHDVVEFGAVKWDFEQNKEIASLQFLLKPREKMSDFIIGIHGITNEMVADAPEMKDKIHEIREFFQGSVLMAHHAPFDMGFICADFEKYHLSLPTEPVICTSLLSRAVIRESQNHKLQTLVKYLGIDGGSAHRALDDARSCLHVGRLCMERLDQELRQNENQSVKLSDVIKRQGTQLAWSQYVARTDSRAVVRNIVEAVEEKKLLEIIYAGGTHKGQKRSVRPIGLVRNPDGDYLKAICLLDGAEKRFYLDKISDSAVLFI